MEPLHVLFLFLIGMAGGFVQRVCGFGLGILVMMFLPHFMPTHTAAAAVSCLFSCSATTFNAVKYQKHISYRTILPVIAAALIAISCSVVFASKVSSALFQILLGIVLVLLSVFFLFLHRRIHIKPTLANGLIAGTVGGTLSGLFATGGPPIVLYLTQATQDKLTYFATIQFYFCVTDLYATGMRIMNGILTLELFLLALIGIAGCLVGDAFGRMVFNRLNANMLKTVIYIGMLISGVLMLF